jgi:hypothetical protein
MEDWFNFVTEVGNFFNRLPILKKEKNLPYTQNKKKEPGGNPKRSLLSSIWYKGTLFG